MIARPITPPVIGTEIAKPCTLQASVGSPNAVLRVKNTGSGDGIRIDSAGLDGIFIDHSEDDGIEINYSGGSGIQIDSTGVGVYVKLADDYGFWARSVSGNGVQIDSTDYEGVNITNSARSGVRIRYASWNGVRIDMAGYYGVDASGNLAGGQFIAATNTAVGLYSNAWQNDLLNEAIHAHGKGVATGGWSFEFEDGNDAPCVVSSERTIIACGRAQIKKGKALILYPKIFTENIRTDIPVCINLTPIGNPSGILSLSETKTTGFGVSLKQIPGWSGDADINFNWIAVGTLKEPKNSSETKAEWEQVTKERKIE